MAQRVVLHVGCMKSGTTFIQQTLISNQDELARQGHIFPGGTWRRHVLGISDFLGMQRDGDRVRGSEGAWDAMVEEIRSHEGTAIISMEYLAAARPVNIRRIVEALAPAHVDVVLTVRDLGRNIPAMWQEKMKNGVVWDWESYLDLVRSGAEQEGGPGYRFWRQLAAVPIAGKWRRVVGNENFYLITVPPPGAPPTLLWERFCSVAGLDPEPFEFGARSNTSLGAASTNVLQLLNEELGEDFLLEDYMEVVKAGLAQDGMAAWRKEEPTLGYTARWIGPRANQMIEGLRSMDLQVVGDLDELKAHPVKGTPPPKVSTDDMLKAAVRALAYMVRETKR
jgi:hypothetical protein